MAAIMGCAVHAGGGTAWDEKFQGDWVSYRLESVPWDNGWLDKMNELTKAVVRASQGRYPVGPCHIRGPSEAAAAMMGHKELCLSIYDRPRELSRLLDICTEVWLEVVRSQYELVPSYAGGYYYPSVPLWAPGKTMVIAADATTLVSPRVFEEIFRPHMERISQRLEYAWMHTHSTYLHMLDSLLRIERLRAIQVTVDLSGPSVEALLPVFRKIQSCVPLIVSGPLNGDELRTLIEGLSPRGLYVLSIVGNAQAGNRLLDSVVGTIE